MAELGYGEASDELDAIIAELERGVIDVDLLEVRLRRAVEIVEELDRRIRGAREKVGSLLPGSRRWPRTPAARTRAGSRNNLAEIRRRRRRRPGRPARLRGPAQRGLRGAAEAGRRRGAPALRPAAVVQAVPGGRLGAGPVHAQNGSDTRRARHRARPRHGRAGLDLGGAPVELSDGAVPRLRRARHRHRGEPRPLPGLAGRPDVFSLRTSTMPSRYAAVISKRALGS